MSDMQARRLALLGGAAQPAAASPTDIAAFVSALAEASQALQSANRLIAASQDREEADESAEMQALRAECEACEARLLQETAARGVAEGECNGLRVALQAAEARAAAAESALAIALARPHEFQVAAPSVQLPASQTPPVPKSWLIEGKDANGNPRKTRMTPEY